MNPTQPSLDKSVEASSTKTRGRGVRSHRTGWVTVLRGGPIIALLALVLYLSLVSPHFATLGNAKNLAHQNAHLAILAVGETIIIIGAGIDLSLGAVMAVSACTTAVLATQQVFVLGIAIGPLNVWLAMLLGLAIGALAGLINGLVITKGRIPDFIATLGMMETARGVALLVTGGLPVPNYMATSAVNKGQIPPELVWIGGKTIWGIPTGGILAVLVVFICWVIMTRTRLGRAIYAMGGNKEAARVSGINVDRTKVISYVIMGLLAGVAGVVMTGRMQSANALMGSGDELKAIGAVVVGGTNLFGGEGSIIGTLIGAIIMGVLGNGLNLLNVSAFWQRVLMGIVIVLVVVFDQWRRRRFRA